MEVSFIMEVLIIEVPLCIIIYYVRDIIGPCKSNTRSDPFLTLMLYIISMINTAEVHLSEMSWLSLIWCLISCMIFIPSPSHSAGKILASYILWRV